MKKLATLLAASLLLGSAFASTSPTPKKAYQAGRMWVINVGVAIPTGDLQDGGVDIAFMASADYHMGTMGDGSTNASWYAGLGFFFGNGDADTSVTVWGAHVGLLFGLGQPGTDNPWFIDVRAGLYQSRISDGIDEDDSGFGGAIGVVYKPTNSGGNGVRFGAGFYMFPEVAGANNTGWYFNVGFPVGGG